MGNATADKAEPSEDGKGGSSFHLDLRSSAFSNFFSKSEVIDLRSSLLWRFALKWSMTLEPTGRSYRNEIVFMFSFTFSLFYNVSQTKGFPTSSWILFGKFRVKRGFCLAVSSVIIFVDSMFSCVQSWLFVRASKLSRNANELSFVEGSWAINLWNCLCWLSSF